jgi:ketosteroid isomerase-like protein
MNKLNFVACIAMLTLSACGHRPGIDTAAVEEEIRTGLREWMSAYNAGDVDTVMKRYAADAVVMPPESPAYVGSQKVREVWAEGSTSLREEGLAVAIRDGSEVKVSSDVAWHSGAYYYKTNAGGEEAGGYFLEVLEKRDGQWLVTRIMWTTDHPPAEAAPPEAAPAAPAPPPNA